MQVTSNLRITVEASRKAAVLAWLEANGVPCYYVGPVGEMTEWELDFSGVHDVSTIAELLTHLANVQ
jgi:hypothetical protein